MITKLKRNRLQQLKEISGKLTKQLCKHEVTKWNSLSKNTVSQSNLPLNSFENIEILYGRIEDMLKKVHFI